MYPSADARTILLLCSHLGLAANSELSPLTLRRWNPLVRKIETSSLGSPGALLDLTATELQDELDLLDHEAEQLARLLGRGEALSVELERLESLGIWVATRADTHYPQRLRDRLDASAPPVLFGAGEPDRLGQLGLAVVGSRDVDDRGRDCAEFVGEACAQAGLVLYSGGARGVDSLSMGAALQAGGQVVGVLAHSLESLIRPPETQEAIWEGDLTLVSPYLPRAGFSVGAAMGRNKLIYALADYALVVASSAGKGGTWTGATEALKARWAPLFVLDGPQVPEGNRRLLQRGGLSFPITSMDSSLSLGDWLQSQSAAFEPPPVQPRLF